MQTQIADSQCLACITVMKALGNILLCSDNSYDPVGQRQQHLSLCCTDSDWLHFALPPLCSACRDITIDSPVLDFLLSSSSACEGATVAPMWNKLVFNKGWMDGSLIQNRLVTAYAYYTLAVGICLKSQDCSSCWPIAQPGCGLSGSDTAPAVPSAPVLHSVHFPASSSVLISPVLDLSAYLEEALARLLLRSAHLCGTALVLQLAGLLLTKKAVSKQQLQFCTVVCWTVKHFCIAQVEHRGQSNSGRGTTFCNQN